MSINTNSTSDVRRHKSTEPGNRSGGKAKNARTDKRILLHHFRTELISFSWLLVLLTCIGIVAGFLCETLTYAPEYSVSVVSTVSQDITGSENYYNQATAKQIAAAFPKLLSGQTLRSELAELSGTGKVGSITASASEESNLFTITATADNPELAYSTILTLIKYYPSLAEKVLGPTQLTLLTMPVMPQEPTNKYSPKSAMTIGGAAGLIVSLAIILLIAYLKDTVILPDDAESKIGCNCAGMIPFIKRKKTSADNAPNILFGDILQNGFSQAVHSATNKLLINANREKKDGCKVIFVTSTAAGEGKTTAAINIAAVIAEKNRKVVLIDADIKSPAVRAAIKTDGGIPEGYKGFYGILHENSGAEEQILKVRHSKLKVILDSGFSEDDYDQEYIDKSADYLASDKMKALIDHLRGKYDYVIIDTAPAGIVADAASVAGYADGFVYIIRQDSIRSEKIRDTIDSFSGIGAKCFGTVINMSRYAGKSYGSYGYGYGKYGYGKYGKYGYGKYGTEKDNSAYQA